MTVREVSSSYQHLLGRREQVVVATRAAAASACADHPRLSTAIGALLDHDRSWESVFRLLSLPIAGALGIDTDLALPVCVLSRLWWVGAETFDDINDGKFDALATELSVPEAMIASTACLTLLPQVVIARQDWAEWVKHDTQEELRNATLHSAEGQMSDVAPNHDVGTWARVMRSYAGKTGTPYARDVVITAQVSGVPTSDIRRWRAFGGLFGVIRQLANDRASLMADDGEDLSNGTRTLLLAHASEAVPESDRDEFSDLCTQARYNPASRQNLRARLICGDVARTYDDRLNLLASRLSLLWQTLVAPSDDRDLVQWMINESVAAARLSDIEVAHDYG